MRAVVYAVPGVSQPHLMLTAIYSTTGCGRKKWPPKFFCRFLSNRFGF